MSTYDVKVHDIAKRDDRGKGKSYRVRWIVAGKRFERSFITKALADQFRNGLLSATKAGTAFDEVTGLPEPLVKERNRTTFYEHARSYVEMKWPRLAAKSRRSMVEALTTVTPALVTSDRGAPDSAVLRRALYGWAFNPNNWDGELAEDAEQALAWLTKMSQPMVRLADTEIVRTALNACTKKLDGKPSAATVVQRKRAVLYNTLGYAVERGILDFNPVDKIQWTAPAVAQQVDRRVVANVDQVERILAALPGADRQGACLVAFFGCLYFGGLRPSEAASLRDQDCTLPDRGWGTLALAETAPHAGSDWTDDGATREVRGLKHRPENEVRYVPIPPVLVTMLRLHCERFGLAADGRLFRASRGGYLSESAYSQAWKKARKAALTPEQVASPLAGRPYDLRHAAVTLWLNCGVPATEVAYRAGHGVAVLLKVYAGCIDGESELINTRIERALVVSRHQGRSGSRAVRYGARRPRGKLA
jgi:integrase